ncbi:MAG: heat-inducible transcriptional repressor HrcA [Clostridia bacterium]|nr:heat-inducible transcriptional repressor HrcA [Clostridia bacterium]
MKLSDRKKKILQYVIDDYISTAQPVSSKSINEKYLPDLSSATIRSELAGLEEMGYLSQPHTSSGRVPSIEAYKLYVAELMDKSKLTGKELGKIKSAFKDHADNLEEVVQNAVKVISELTDYTSVACAAHSENDVIKKVEIFRHKKNQALLLILTENTLIRDKFISVPPQMTDGQIAEAAEMMTKLFVGKKLGEIVKMPDKITEEFDTYRDIFDSVMQAIEEYIDKKKGEIIMEGQGKILNHPEYNDTEKVKNFLSVISDKDRIADLLFTDSDDIEISIKVGGEDDDADYSLVSATYSASGVNLGTYGVIGPLRMDYQKVVSVLEGVGKILENLIKDSDEDD